MAANDALSHTDLAGLDRLEWKNQSYQPRRKTNVLLHTDPLNFCARINLLCPSNLSGVRGHCAPTATHFYAMNNLPTTSYGQRLLKERLSFAINGEPLENHRPNWLMGLELDFYYPDHGLAFEFQGDQHFLPVFGEEALIKQQRNDSWKRLACRQNHVVLVKVEAWELPKLKLKTKLHAALNSYRKMDFKTKSERKKWINEVLNKRFKKHTKLVKFEFRNQANQYVKTIANNFGGITSIPKRHNRLREKAANAFS